MVNNTKRSGMSPVLAFILGFLVALILVIGAVVGVIVYGLNYKLDNLAFNKDEENNYIYINADPEGDAATVIKLINKVQELAGNTENLTLGELEKTFPIAGSLVNLIQEKLGSFVQLDTERLKNTTVSELGDFLNDTIMAVEPASLLRSISEESTDNKILHLILYDEEDNPITIKDFAEGGVFDRLLDTPVVELIESEEETDEVTRELLGDATLGDLLDGYDFGEKTNSLTLANFIKVTLPAGKPRTQDCMLGYIVYGLCDIQYTPSQDGYTHTATYIPLEGERIYPCYINTNEDEEVIEVFYYADGEKVEIKGTSINDVSVRAERITSDLTIGQLMDVTGNSMLEMLADSTIDGLSEDINKLAVNQLYASSIYASGKSAEDETPIKYLAVPATSPMERAQTCLNGYIYYKKQGENYVLASTTGKLASFEAGVEYYTPGEGKILFSPVYVYYDEEGKMINAGEDNAGKASAYRENLYTYGVPNATWKLLLYSGGSEVVFSVNGLSKMIDNVTENIIASTMRDLDEAGIVDMGENLNKRISVPPPVTSPHNGEYIGDLTLEDLLNLFTLMATAGS